jgi:hypothetical protein
VWQQCKGVWNLGQGPWLISDTDVDLRLSRDAFALGLTRMQDGKFKKLCPVQPFKGDLNFLILKKYSILVGLARSQQEVRV